MIIYPMDYTTFEKFDRQIRSQTNDTSVVTDYAIIRQYIGAASRFMGSDKVTNRNFVPYNHTHEIENTSVNFDASGRFMWLPDDCFAITTFKNVGGATIGSSLYRFRYQYKQTHMQVELDSNIQIGATSSTSFVPRFEIVGTWGYHRNYTDAWVDSTTLNGAIDNDATTTTVTVNAVTDLERLQYIKVDDEYMQITGAIPTSAPLDLTVKRAVNGSTIANHDDAATVSYWSMEPDVEFAVTRLAVGLYRTRHNAGSQLRFIDGSVLVEGDEKSVTRIADYLMKPKQWRGCN